MLCEKKSLIVSFLYLTFKDVSNFNNNNNTAKRVGQGLCFYQHNISKTQGPIFMKPGGKVDHGLWEKQLNFHTEWSLHVSTL